MEAGISFWLNQALFAGEMTIANYCRPEILSKQCSKSPRDYPPLVEWELDERPLYPRKRPFR